MRQRDYPAATLLAQTGRTLAFVAGVCVFLAVSALGIAPVAYDYILFVPGNGWWVVGWLVLAAVAAIATHAILAARSDYYLAVIDTARSTRVIADEITKLRSDATQQPDEIQLSAEMATSSTDDAP